MSAMGKKKPKSGKRNKKRSRSDDVKASTSLPPSVDGQLRCFLRVTVSKIKWDLRKAPEVFSLRLKWWGEQTDGSIFRPWDGREETKPLARKTARYPIRCGPKQFAEYLTAMSTCVLELLKGDQLTCIGMATISELGILAPQSPISGVYPVFSNQKAEKLAEVTVSMKFEPLPVSYDSSSSVPTTDISLPAHSGHTTDGSTAPPPSILKRRAGALPPTETARTKESTTESRQTPSGLDDDFSFVVGPGAGAIRGTSRSNRGHEFRGSQQSVRAVPDSAVSDSGTDILSDTKNGPSPKTGRDKYEMRPTSEVGKHLISTILDKGNHLMDSMIRAQCVAQPKGPEGPKPDPSVASTESTPAAYPLRRSSSGELFRELLKDEEVGSSHPPVSLVVPAERKGSVDPTLQLVIGDDVTEQELRHLKTVVCLCPFCELLNEEEVGNSHSPVSLVTPAEGKGSVDSTPQLVICDDITEKELKNSRTLTETSPVESDISEGFGGLSSDSDDPLHEDSILEELFYKGQRTSSDSDGLSDLLLSSDSEAEVGGRKRKQHKKVQLRKRRSRKKSSSDGPDEPVPQVADTPGGNVLGEDRLSSKHVEKMVESEDSASGGDSSSVMTVLQMSTTGVEGLSVQRLTLLGRVHAARVAIDTLTLTQRVPALCTKTRIPQRVADKDVVRGKPPRPHVKSTYFVEYQFPVSASSEDSMATEVMRVVSKKIIEKDGKCEVQFGHRSVFPVQFDGSTVDHWWTRLLVLRIYHKLAGQKTPSLIAVASTPLRSILRSPDFAVTFDLPVVSKDAAERLSTSTSSSFTTDTTTSPEGSINQLGVIKVSIELTSDSKDFTAALARMKVAELKGSKVIPLPTEQGLRSQSRERYSHEGHSREKTSRSTERVITSDSAGIKRMPMDSASADADQDGLAMIGRRGPQEQEHLTLHTLLMITDGRGITVQGVKPLAAHNKRSTTQKAHQGRDFVTRNPYLICKMFWSDDAVHSHVCWGATEPQFNFSQVAPVLLTPALLERTRNNFMVVEVWDKKTSGQNDVLVGIAKLPLHQFYMSFRDQKIASAILKSQYPVVGIDNYAPVIDPFSGEHYGQIRVLLAMGAFHQISSLQRLKGDAVIDVPKPERPSNYLERSERPQPRVEKPDTKDDCQENVQVEHTFEVVIEGVRSLPQGDDSVWGEADCFVQYHFPSQEAQYNHLQGSLSLRSFRTATTLCLPDPVFNEVTRHQISLPQDVPVQRELLNACVGVGGAAGCIPMELWCRYYYPNVRDQVIAKAHLPLAKLCAMVTMQRRGEPSIQTFHLPLTAQQETEGNQVSSGGFLDVTVSYRQSSHRVDRPATDQSLSSSFPQVTLTVAVLRASGLQAAALFLARYHPSLQYASEVGVNAFTTVQLTFLPKEELKRSRTIARSFAPELSHHMDFSCPMILQCKGQRSGSRESPLAEVLETGDVVIKIWHQVQQSHEDHPLDVLHPDKDGNIAGRQLVAPPKEILLGSTTIPLRNLLLKRTGITGRFPVTMPPPSGWDTTSLDHHPADDSRATMEEHDPPLQGDSREGGSIELVVRFTQKADREKVLQVGERMGWTPPMGWDDQETAEYLSLPVTIGIRIDRVMFHEQSLLKPGQTRIKDDSHAYIRYQFYDKRPTFSRFVPIRQSHDGQLSADVRHTEHVKLTMNPSLSWYMKEEQFVVQVWVSQDAEKGSLPKKRDRQIGSAHIDLTNLITGSSRQQKTSGLYPLSKPGVNNMHGAHLRVTVTMTTGEQPQHSPEKSSSDEVMISEEERDEPTIGGEGATDYPQPSPSPEPEAVLEPAPFELHIERAMGLCTSPQRWHSTPLSTYVSLTVGDAEPLLTPTVPDSPRPFWNHYREILLDPHDVVEKQHLIFKVWHQTTGRQDMSCDRMLGFTSVDLGPLLVGFRSLNGWYNIMDFSGQVKGQMKIAITPKRDLSVLKPRAVQFMGQNSLPCVSGHLLPIHSRHPHQLSPPPYSAPSGRHHGEHVRGVRESHEKLRHAHSQEEGAAEDPALSRLKENLRKNLADLDSLKVHLDRKRRGLDGHPPSLDKRAEYANEGHSETRELLTDQTIREPLAQRTERGAGASSPVEINEDVTQFKNDTRSKSTVQDLDSRVDVPYHRTSQTRETLETLDEEEEEEGIHISSVPSQSLEDSDSEIEGNIVIPRTLNEVVADEEIRQETWGQGGQGIDNEGGSVVNSMETISGGREDVDEGQRMSAFGGYQREEEVGSAMNLEENAQGYETPEEALERIQQRIMRVVGPEAVIMRTGGKPRRNGGTADDRSSLGNGQPPDMFLQTVSVLRGREADVEVISDDEGGSAVSDSPSEQEELASFASSRDEGENSRTVGGSMGERPRTSSPERDVCSENGREIRDEQLVAGKGESQEQLDQDSGIKSDGMTTLLRDESVGHHHMVGMQHRSDEGMRRCSDGEDPEASGGPEKERMPQHEMEDEHRLHPGEESRAYSQRSPPPTDTPLAFKLPNFFLPRDDLASAMRTLDSAVSGPPASRVPEIGSLSERIQAAREVTRRMKDGARAGKPSSQSSRPKKFTRAQPTAEEAKRIARIFATKYSPP